MSGELNVALLQLTSIDDIETNLKNIESLISKAPEKTQLYCLPENALWMRMLEGGEVQALDLKDSVFSRLSSLAKEKKAWIHIGSAPLKKKQKVINSSVLISPQGQVLSTYQKIHLFDIELDGQPPIRESDVFEGGQHPQVINLEGWKVGQTICYDLRFAELFSFYVQQQVDMILVPSAFLVPTGKAHWEVLLRARAIESQVYIVAAAQAGHHRSDLGERFTFGQSLVVDPWGQIIAKGSNDQPELLSVTLSKDLLNKVRQQIPMRHHRKLVAVKN